MYSFGFGGAELYHLPALFWESVYPAHPNGAVPTDISYLCLFIQLIEDIWSLLGTGILAGVAPTACPARGNTGQLSSLFPTHCKDAAKGRNCPQVSTLIAENC